MTNHDAAATATAMPADSGSVDGWPEWSPTPSVWARRMLGVIALSFSALGLLALLIGVAIASPADANETAWATATVLSWLANGLTAAGVLAGIVAMMLRRGPKLGAVAIVLGVLSNPFLQLAAFGALG